MSDPVPPQADPSEFYLQFGMAMLTWANVEAALRDWFSRISGMSNRMAEAIFYTHNGFTGRSKVLKAALEHSGLSEAAFLKAAIQKADSYGGFRNKLAHGETIYLDKWEDGRHQGNKYRLVEFKNRFSSPLMGIDLAQLRNMSNNFSTLSGLLRNAYFHPIAPERFASAEECHRQLDRLPNDPREEAVAF